MKLWWFRSFPDDGVFANISVLETAAQRGVVMQRWVELLLLQTWERVSAPELFQCKVWLLSTESPSDFS